VLGRNVGFATGLTAVFSHRIRPCRLRASRDRNCKIAVFSCWELVASDARCFEFSYRCVCSVHPCSVVSGMDGLCMLSCMLSRCTACHLGVQRRCVREQDGSPQISKKRFWASLICHNTSNGEICRAVDRVSSGVVHKFRDMARNYWIQV